MAVAGITHKIENRVEPPISDYFHSSRRFYDAKEKINVIKIFSGDWYVSKSKDEMISTILGSCVSACIRDPEVGVGGMNHFLLPGDGTMDALGNDSTRYGMFAMERLINEIIKSGGRKDRLEVKVFGGGNVLSNYSLIGTKNAKFIREFLHKEGLKIESEDLEGNYPRKVNYYPCSGKVMMRFLRRKEDMVVVAEEALYEYKVVSKRIDTDIELF
ncbi:MAG: hypothetical protein R3D71_10620 [Rickettsiales bacterium]